MACTRRRRSGHHGDQKQSTTRGIVRVCCFVALMFPVTLVSGAVAAQQIDRAAAIQRLTGRFDTDGDGKLSDPERRAVRDFIVSRRRAGRGPEGQPTVTAKPDLDKLYKIADGPWKVEAVEKLVLRDEKRGKDLQLRVTFPVEDGPFPVIVWSHGATGTKDTYQPLIHHWASHVGGEVDLLLERDGRLHPIEIKLTTKPTKGDTRGLMALRDTYPRQKVAPGLVMCPTERAQRLTEADYAIPWDSR